ncbi:YVTN family beta-propeller repeat protein [Phytohabitans kaempferiae]|uniref:Beta-propeller fold lactonase family protein n=1 Tax=Phytohabitans kaempferiae TaxID=1620943 RepID=A0ABV6M1E7_9ACTN
MSTVRPAVAGFLMLVLVLAVACEDDQPAAEGASAGPTAGGSASAAASGTNVYAAAGAGMLGEAVRGHRELVYVPNTQSDNVHVIDPKTYKVIDTFYGGPEPQHVVPAYDMKTLYVASSRVPTGGLVPIDPRTGRSGKLINVQDVYNLYFTPDGKQAIVVAEAYKRLDFYDPASWKRTKSLSFPECGGINHMDYSADAKTMLVSCEFANRMIVLDGVTHKKVRQFDLDMSSHGMPQDTRLTPDGRHFLVADMHANGVYVFDGAATKKTGFIPTGKGTHGIYFSRDGARAYVTNRGEGTVTVLDASTLKPVTTWRIPGGGSPDMGGISADGKVLWLSGRYHNEVYALNMDDGRLLARIPVGSGPHGLTIWPQPGRFSLGHTGNIR